MVIKLNKKVLTVDDETKEDKEKTIPYFLVSCTGYGLILWIMDMVCNTFFFIHPFPFLSILLHSISGWITFLGGLL
jgi:hypothetical protein